MRLKLVSHQETTAWQLLATLTTAFLNDCLTILSKYLAILLYSDWSTTVGRHTCDRSANRTTTGRLVEYFGRMFAKVAHVCRRRFIISSLTYSDCISTMVRPCSKWSEFGNRFLDWFTILDYWRLQSESWTMCWRTRRIIMLVIFYLPFLPPLFVILSGSCSDSVIWIIRWFILITGWSWSIMLVRFRLLFRSLIWFQAYKECERQKLLPIIFFTCTLSIGPILI